MEEFVEVKRLRGAIYGQVTLVRHRRSDALFAMKMMSLSHMLVQRAVSGPRVREDGNRELRILRRISGNRVYEDGSPTNDDNSNSWSVHPQWEAAIGHGGNVPTDNASHGHLLMLHTDFIDPVSQSRCLVFDYCPHGELYDQLRASDTKSLPIDTARAFFLQIATAVRAIHALEIAHRDVSLENVLLDEKRECRLGDFGLACEQGTVCQGRVGKAFYMAPEVYDWQPEEVYNGLLADMWSLGVVLFMMVTGVPPFEVPNETDARFRMVKRNGINQLLSRWQLDSHLPLGLRDLLSRLLCVDVSERLDIERMWLHPWLCESYSSSYFDHKEPQEELEVDAMVATDDEEKTIVVMPPTTSGGHGRRMRKRIKITIDNDQSAFLTDQPPRLCHESTTYSDVACLTDGAIMLTSRNQATTLIPPHASPMVWPRMGGKHALRRFFRPRKELQYDSEYPDTEEEGKDSMETSRRRPRLDSSSSCSSSCSSSSYSSIRQVDDVGHEDPPRPTTVLCRFCLQWVNMEHCTHRVTLPTSRRGFVGADEDTIGHEKTRRVCDMCYATIMSGRHNDGQRVRTRTSSSGSNGSSSGSNASWFFGVSYNGQSNAAQVA